MLFNNTFKMSCEKLNNCRTGISKKDNYIYTFDYIDKDGLPGNYKKQQMTN